MSSPVQSSDDSSPIRYNLRSSSPGRFGTSARSSSPTSHVPGTRSMAATPVRSTHRSRDNPTTPSWKDRGLRRRYAPHVAARSDGIDGKQYDAVSSERVGPAQQVWGTNVNVEESKRHFRKFWDEFIDPDTKKPKYPQLLDDALKENARCINLNCRDLYQFDRRLYHQLQYYPQELVSIIDIVVDEKRNQSNPDGFFNEKMQILPHNLIETINMRALNPKDIDTLVSVKGMVIRVGDIIPEMRAAYFQCSICNQSQEVVIEEGEITEPTKCPNANCSGKGCMELIHNRSEFSDKQLVKLQETPDSIPEGETPHTVTVYVFEDLVDIAKPGDRVEITAVFRADTKRVSRRLKSVRTVYRTYLDALHFKKCHPNRLSAEDSKAAKDSESYTPFEESDVALSVIREREARLREISKDPDIYEKLTRSFAPNIYEHQDIKKGILCLLFGGANNDVGAIQGRFRGEINILLVGDPGTAKSQMLQHVHRIAPRGIYTSGKGSSAVGLTASLGKDPETGERVLESGALVLSDRGICCIDEFDKMSDATRSILHEVMEQQTISIAKAGIVATLNARTSILASANPIDSRYNTNMSVVKNINLGPTLLSRFDLIYLVLDQPNEAADRRLGKHLVSLYHQEPGTETKQYTQDILTTADLTQYISYARRNINPKLTNQTEKMLVDGYLEMRQFGQREGAKVVSATPRQLESLIRLSEALARMRFSQQVAPQDVTEAIRLMKIATQTAATDPRTGRIDMDLLTTGLSAGERLRKDQVNTVIKELLQGKPEGMRKDQILDKINKSAGGSLRINPGEFDDILDELRDHGDITVGSKGSFKGLVRLMI